jgi:hypothetical protein
MDITSDIHIDYSYSESVDELMIALAKAQAKMDNPLCDSTNPHYNSKYASLAVTRDAVIKPLATEGIATVQLPSTADRMVTCTTMLFLGNQFLKSVLRMPVVKRSREGGGELTPQDYAAALSWARRIGLTTIAVVAGDEDDDGNTASGKSGIGRRSNEGRPQPGHMVGGEPRREEDEEADAHLEILQTIHEKVRKVLTPLRHAGIHKAVLYHSFGFADARIKDQPLAILQQGKPTFDYLCAVLEDADEVAAARVAPDKWVEATIRARIAAVEGESPAQEEAADPGTTGPSWGPESTNGTDEGEESIQEPETVEA